MKATREVRRSPCDPDVRYAASSSLRCAFADLSFWTLAWRGILLDASDEDIYLEKDIAKCWNDESSRSLRSKKSSLGKSGQQGLAPSGSGPPTLAANANHVTGRSYTNVDSLLVMTSPVDDLTLWLVAAVAGESEFTVPPLHRLYSHLLN